MNWLTEDLARVRLDEIRREAQVSSRVLEARRARSLRNPPPKWRRAVGRRLVRAGLRLSGVPVNRAVVTLPLTLDAEAGT